MRCAVYLTLVILGADCSMSEAFLFGWFGRGRTSPSAPPPATPASPPRATTSAAEARGSASSEHNAHHHEHHHHEHTHDSTPLAAPPSPSPPSPSVPQNLRRRKWRREPPPSPPSPSPPPPPPSLASPALAPSPTAACAMPVLLARTSKCCMCFPHVAHTNGTTTSILASGVPSTAGRFGCYAGVQPGAWPVIWTDQRCGGLFQCSNGQLVRCGSSRSGARMNCTCHPPPPAAPPHPHHPPVPARPPRPPKAAVHPARRDYSPSPPPPSVPLVAPPPPPLPSSIGRVRPATPHPVAPSTPAGSCWLLFPSGCPSGDRSGPTGQWVRDAWGEDHGYKDGHAGCLRRQQHLRTWCGVDDVRTHLVSPSDTLEPPAHVPAMNATSEVSPSVVPEASPLQPVIQGEPAACKPFCPTVPQDKRSHWCKCRACASVPDAHRLAEGASCGKGTPAASL